MFGRFLVNSGKLVLMLLITAMPGAILFGALTPGQIDGFLVALLTLMAFAAAALLMASPFLLLLRLIGHRSWWSRLALAVCAGAVCGLTLGFMPDSDPSRTAIAVFNPRAAAFGAFVGGVFGLWGGTWWCYFFQSGTREPREKT